MFNLQGSEIIFILLIALVVLGPEKLPGAIRKATQTYAEFRKMSSSFQSEFKSVIDEPLREMRETADLVKETADPKKMAERAEAEAEAEAKAEADAKLKKKADQAASVTAAMETGGSVETPRDAPAELSIVADPVDDADGADIGVGVGDEVDDDEFDEFADPVIAEAAETSDDSGLAANEDLDAEPTAAEIDADDPSEAIEAIEVIDPSEAIEVIDEIEVEETDIDDVPGAASA